LQSIASSKSGSSASVLAEVLDCVGVKDGEGATAASAFTVRGARELGGPVSARSMYRVNEKGPELLQVAGKQYLMTGHHSGNVVPHQNARDSGMDRPIEVHQNFAIAGPTSTANQSQIAAAALNGLRRAAKRDC